MSVYPGTTIDWLPSLVSDILRVSLWAGLISASIWMAYNAVKYDSPLNVVLGRAALFVLFMQQAISHAERYRQPLTYESLPSFLAIALVYAALIAEKRARQKK